MKKNATHGWRGKILRVDLSDSDVREEELSIELMQHYIGGAGLNARLLYYLTHKNHEADPLVPESPLIFGCGPVVGIAFPCATRYTVTAN